MASPRVASTLLSRTTTKSLKPEKAVSSSVQEVSKGASSSSKRASEKNNSKDIIRCVCSSTGDKGHMIECEQCSSWCHSKCVGVSTSLAASFPYVCPFCIKSVFFKLSSIASTMSDACVRLTALETSFSKSIPPMVQEEFLKVTESLQQISSKVSSYPSEVLQSTQHSGPSFSSILKTQPSTSQESSSGLPPAQSISTAERRRFNVVLFGVSEQQHGLPRPQRLNKDLDSVLTIVADKVGGPHGIRDCHRIGKYVKDKQHPRPILVTLNSIACVRSLLTVVYQLVRTY